MGLAYILLFRRRIVEKFLKQFRVGVAFVTFCGNVATEDDLGRRTYYDCGLVWDPREIDTGRTVLNENCVIVDGDPGPKVSIRIFKVSLNDRMVLGELPPSFINERRGIRIWSYRESILVTIEGERVAENWTISHWRMFSGRICFDMAKNKFPREGVVTEENGSGEPDPNDIAGRQLDEGRAKNGNRG